MSGSTDAMAANATIPPMPQSSRVVLVPLPAPLLSGACGLVLVAVAHYRFRARRYRVRD